jgi:hypothetical protein
MMVVGVVRSLISGNNGKLNLEVKKGWTSLDAAIKETLEVGVNRQAGLCRSWIRPVFIHLSLENLRQYQRHRYKVDVQ